MDWKKILDIKNARDKGHSLLSWMGLVPGLGIAPDLLNTAWYKAEGKTLSDKDLRDSLLASVPGVLGLGAGIKKKGEKARLAKKNLKDELDKKNLKLDIEGKIPDIQHNREAYEMLEFDILDEALETPNVSNQSLDDIMDFLMKFRKSKTIQDLYDILKKFD
tara:strand:- start:499 stop:984 length:486 start_codon:yes stop_codon:yes gene_type:complete